MNAPGSLSGSRLKILTALIACCLILAVGYYLTKPNASETSNRELIAIGSVTSLIGEADHRLPQTLETLPAQQGLTLHSGETFLTRHASEAIVTFAGGGSIRLGPGAKFVGERDASGKEGAVLGTVIEGDAQLLSEGSVGSLRVLKNGRELSVGILAAPQPVVVPSAGPKTPSAGTGVVITATTPVETPTPFPRGNGGENIGGPNRSQAEINETTRETLSNDEIRKSLRSNGGFFQRCYLTYLNRVKPEPSQRVSTVTVGFVINSLGKVQNAKIVRTDFKDAVLNNCVLETIERTSFRAFRGNNIPVLEFPIELN